MTAAVIPFCNPPILPCYSKTKRTNNRFTSYLSYYHVLLPGSQGGPKAQQDVL